MKLVRQDCPQIGVAEQAIGHNTLRSRLEALLQPCCPASHKALQGVAFPSVTDVTRHRSQGDGTCIGSVILDADRLPFCSMNVWLHLQRARHFHDGAADAGADGAASCC